MARMTADERREKLLEAAERVMTRDGVAAGTTRAIVTEAGMAPSVFHYCFRSRDEMISELILRLGMRERTATWDGVVPSQDLREMLASALRAYLGHLTANAEQELVLIELNHYALRTPGLEHLARRQYEMYHESVALILDLAVAHTGHRWRFDAHTMARLVLTILDGATLTWLADRNSEVTQVVVDSLLDHVVSLAEPVGTAP
jgi:AcrR family transcriptional regulator